MPKQLRRPFSRDPKLILKLLLEYIKEAKDPPILIMLPTTNIDDHSSFSYSNVYRSK